MDPQFDIAREWMRKPTLHPERARWLRRVDALAQIIGVTALVMGHGVRRTGIPPWEFGAIQLLCMAIITVAIAVRYRWSLAKLSFTRRHLATVLAAAVWTAGIAVVTIIGPILPDLNEARFGGGRWWGYIEVTEVVLLAYSAFGIVAGLRRVSSGGINPAFLLVLSFVLLISVGTGILMLPICRETSEFEAHTGAPFLTALFTATSAACVTGLIVEHTGNYWSFVGQLVILMLFQVGGLGIMTFGAFFAAIAGRNVRLSEFATLRDLFSTEGLGDLRRLIFVILGYTLFLELIGAILLMGLWSDLPWGQRVFMSVFHSVSAFCNAGFALTEDSFVGMAHHWQVRYAIPLLIIVGGLGFAVVYNLQQYVSIALQRILDREPFRLPHKRPRIRLTTRLVLVTTGVLLVAGTLGIYLLERTAADHHRIAWDDAWFQSVTFRTAGFNTVDLGQLQPGTKLLGILLMAIGASPGSTGGGMKTTVFAVTFVGLISVMRGRERVEVFGRTLPAINLNRALAILFVTLISVMTTTLLLVTFEKRPDYFLDHMFEAASAVGTVGVSSTIPLDNGEMGSVTSSLSTPSRIVIIFAMFLGRVGPLTLLLALAGEGPSIRYEYPSEKVTLG
ncbi:MAG: hypothetical protein KDA80_12965 [Planctomycetaceae bacterium]|nr:hypothetical protein [Planctomycetaceae bacterium]